MKAKLNMQEKPLSWLKPAEYNPRADLQPGDPEYEKIKRSIESFSYVDPIIANSDGTVIGGHQRLKVLIDLGYDTADVVILDKTKEEEKALNIALNKISGEWDEEKLYELLIELDLSDIDMQLSGFTHSELEDLKVQFDTEEAQEDDDWNEDEAYEEAKKNTRSIPGCVWILGGHRLMVGDSTSADDMAVLMNGETADLVITDPPYNVAYEEKVEDTSEAMGVGVSREHSQILNDDMTDEQFEAFLGAFYRETFEVMREGAAIYVFHADSNGYAFRKKYRDAGLKLAQCLIWEKNTFVPGRQDYQWRHEPILYGWKEGAGHYFINDRTQDTVILEDEIDFKSMKKDELVAYLEQLRAFWADKTSVIWEKKPAKNDLHPTMKPVSLIGRLMKNSSKPGWKVLDPFGGSGTTLMAAEQLNRRAYLMELDPVYADVIVNRWENYTGQTAEMEE
jgi:DNA modification methylase